MHCYSFNHLFKTMLYVCLHTDKDGPNSILSVLLNISCYTNISPAKGCWKGTFNVTKKLVIHKIHMLCSFGVKHQMH